MPRYFFNLTEGATRINDHQGCDLQSDENARAQALQAIQELREEDRNRDWSNWLLEVVDESGRSILTIMLDNFNI